MVTHEFSAVSLATGQKMSVTSLTASTNANNHHSTLVGTRWETQEVIFMHRMVQRLLLSRKEEDGLLTTQEY